MAYATLPTVIPGDVIATSWGNQVKDNFDQLANGYTYVQTIYYDTTEDFEKATYPWLRAVKVKVQAGGGGGGGSGTTGDRVGGGGGGGAYAKKLILVGDLSASETCTIGALGGGGASGNNAGTAGGASSFGAHIVCGGGGGGNSGNGAYDGDNGGLVTTSGDFDLPGHPGSPRSQNATGSSQGGHSALGWGGQPRMDSTNVPGREASVGYGGGGGGGKRSSVNTAGAEGMPGIIILELYA